MVVGDVVTGADSVSPLEPVAGWFWAWVAGV